MNIENIILKHKNMKICRQRSYYFPFFGDIRKTSLLYNACTCTVKNVKLNLFNIYLSIVLKMVRFFDICKMAMKKMQ